MQIDTLDSGWCAVQRILSAFELFCIFLHWRCLFPLLPTSQRLTQGLWLPLGPGSILWTPVCLPSIRACLCCGARLCKSYAFCRRPVARPFLWTFYLPDIYTGNSCLLFTFHGTARQNAKPVLANRVVYALVLLYLHFGQNTATHKVHFVRLCTL